MKERILALADRALHESLFEAPPHPAANPAYADLPEPLRVAYNIRDYFAAYPVRPKSAGELLTDCFYTDGLPVPGCAYRHTSCPSWDAFFHGHSDYEPNGLAMVDWNHYCNNYRFIVDHGMKAYLPRIAEAKKRFEGQKDKLDFLSAMETVCLSVRDLAARYGERVPFEPARSFAEAVESVWFSFLLMPDSVGRLDQVLYPFYRKELDAGTLDRETAEEYIGELLIKIFGHIGYRAHRSGDNTLVLGGYTQDGRDGTNELTVMIAETLVALPIWRPQVSFRWTEKTPHDVMVRMTELNMKSRNIVFTSDEARFRAFAALGIEKEDYIDYSMIGCNEWSIMGKSNSGSDGFFNTAAALEEVLYFQRDKVLSCRTYEDFHALFLRALGQKINFMCDLADGFYRANSGDCNVLSSLMTEGCIEQARSLTAGGAKYNFSCWSAIGLINTADSLSVIRKFVYKDSVWTMEELFSALDRNWENCAQMEKQLRDCGMFFGCDNIPADETVNTLIRDMTGLARRRKPGKGGVYIFGCYTGYNHAHITMGLRTRATPDGRRNGEAFTGAISAAPSRDKEGLTAYLKSAARLDYTRLCAPLAVNLRLDSACVRHPDLMASLYEVYFKEGGLQLQPDYVSAEQLRAAQEHPEQWSGLRVRVTGFSGFYTQFDRCLQDEILRRTEHRI